MGSKEGTKMEYYVDQESATRPLNASRRCCCFPTTTTVWWDKIKSKTTTTSSTGSFSTRLWDNGITALKKFREWSELVAGPKWKTFIRRFNRPAKNRAAGGGGNFQYDPLSYALNFDDGVGQNGDFDDGGGVRDFSARYVSSVSVSGS